MFKIDAMRLVGLQDKEGLIISWQPDGILIEMSQHKASGVPEGGWGEGGDMQSQLQMEGGSWVPEGGWGDGGDI